MPHKDPAASKEYFRQYHLRNKEKKNAVSKKHYDENKPTYNLKSKEYWIKNKEEIRLSRIKRRKENTDIVNREERLRHRRKNIKKYKLEELNLPEVLECELCGSNNRVAFDHDHVSGNFRGLLCLSCNVALGLVKDDINLLQKMINYLQEGGIYSKL